VSYARSPNEDNFVNTYLEKEIRALGVSADLQQKFIAFAVKEGGTDREKFRPRLYHIVNGRTPSAYIALLLVRFFQERRYEDFIRTEKDHVEYITSNGDTTELEKLVSSHPLTLRVVRMRMTNWVVTGKPEAIYCSLRSPIKNPDDWDAIDEATGLDQLNARLRDFNQWLAAGEKVPESHRLESGQVIPIRYEPDWLRFSDEQGFEFHSDLEGSVDISHGIDLLIYAELGPSSPYIPPGLDVFYNLSSIFQGTEAKPAPKVLSFANYWPRIVAEQSDFAQIFFARIDQFPKNVRRPLESFFKRFANQHRTSVKKAFVDKKISDEQGDAYVPRPEDVTHYNRLTNLFFEELRPLLKRCWAPFAQTALKILEAERMRARAHWEKMKKHFG
jgi:hypothetical protein